MIRKGILRLSGTSVICLFMSLRLEAHTAGSVNTSIHFSRDRSWCLNTSSVIDCVLELTSTGYKIINSCPVISLLSKSE